MAKLYIVSNDDTRLLFECPGCACAHQIIVKSDTRPVWQWNGSMDRPTFSPSLLIQYDGWEPPVNSDNYEQFRSNPWPQTKVRKICHSFIRDGQIQFLGDCTHKLVGQTVDLRDVEIYLEGEYETNNR